MSKFLRFLLIEQYLFSIKTKLPYARKKRQDRIKDFREFIYSCLDSEDSEDTVTCKQDLYNLFGTVERVIENHVHTIDKFESAEFQKETKRNKILLGILILLTIVILIVAALINLLPQKYVFTYETGELESSLYEEVQY